MTLGEEVELWHNLGLSINHKIVNAAWDSTTCEVFEPLQLYLFGRAIRTYEPL